MKCRKCKYELPDDAKYCMKCGIKQAMKKGVKTRGNGQGTAIQRGKTWTAIWTEEIIPDPETRKAKLKRRSKGGFPTKKAALIYAANPTPKVEAPTLRSYWTLYERSDYQDLSKSKQGAHSIAWRKLEGLARYPMDQLTIDMLQSTVDAKAPTYYPARDMKTVLSHLFRRAVAEGNARTNLSEFIRLPPLEEEEADPFSELELHKFWQAYGDGEHFVGYLLIMIYSGMMPGELFKLKPEMVDLDKREIVGCGAKTKKRKAVPIVFPDLLIPVLRDMIERSNSRSGYVVGVQRDRWYKEYHAVLSRVGVRDLPPYSCRHTTATALALGNIAPSVIQEVMRHTKFSTTQRYIHPDTTDAREAVNTLGRGKDVNNSASNKIS